MQGFNLHGQLHELNLHQCNISRKSIQEFLFWFSFLACNSLALTWFFNHVDANKDLVLDENERAEIETNPDEHCIRKFFGKCDLNNDKNLSFNEICACFMNVGKYI